MLLELAMTEDNAAALLVVAAGVRERVLASMWDLFGLLLPLSVWGLIGPRCMCKGPGPDVINAVGFLIFMSPVLLFHLFRITAHAQSLGKRRQGLRVVRADGGACHPARYLLLRTMPQLACVLVAWAVNLPLLGVALLLVDMLAVLLPWRRCVHDWLSGTVVVKAC